jgi:hypothetical protein
MGKKQNKRTTESLKRTHSVSTQEGVPRTLRGMVRAGIVNNIQMLKNKRENDEYLTGGWVDTNPGSVSTLCKAIRANSDRGRATGRIIRAASRPTSAGGARGQSAVHVDIRE